MIRGAFVIVALYTALGSDVRLGEVLADRAKQPVAATRPRMRLESGRKAGDFVPAYLTRVVTGPLKNRSVCYVCRNGARPVVMLLLRELKPELQPLLAGIDKLIDQNRAAGFKSFGVLLVDDPATAVSAVQTFAFNGRVDLPLAVATQAVAHSNCQNVHPQAAVTIVLYRQRRVAERLAFRSGELTKDRVRGVFSRIERFLRDKRPGRQIPSRN